MKHTPLAWIAESSRDLVPEPKTKGLVRFIGIPPAFALMVSVAFLGATPRSAVADLIAKYSFESMANGTVTDTSGKGNDGIVHGSLSLDLGVSGQAARFDGGGYVEVPASAGIDLGSGSRMTWIVSLKRDNALAGCYERNIPSWEIFSKSDNTPGANADSGLNFQIPNNSPSFYFTHGLGNQRHIEPVAPLGEWSQLVLIKDDANWSLYQNGQALPGFDTALGKPGMWGVGNPFTSGDFEPQNGAPMLIGAALNYNAGAVPIELFKGWMDEISIYDEALTEADLDALGIDITPGATLNSYSLLLGEAPDALRNWPWDPDAVRCGPPCVCPDTLPGWSAWLGLTLPFLWARRIRR